jgi:hypothetical protein
MNEVLIGSLIDKVDAQERKIGIQENQINELKEKVTLIPDNAEAVSQFETALEGLRQDIKLMSFPEKEMRQLSASLETTMMLLKQPVKKEIMHYHHATKTIWIAAALFLVVCLVSTGWYNTYNKLELYKGNDTKYRYLKLEAPAGLYKWLINIDSLYIADTKMRNTVIASEEQNQRNFEMVQRSAELEKEAKELKQKVSGIKTK